MKRRQKVHIRSSAKIALGAPLMLQGPTSSAAATSSGMTDSKMHSARTSASAGAAVHSRERGPEFGGQRPSPKTVLVVHLEHDLRDLFDGADHHHQGGARCAAGQRCINAAGAASLPPPQRSHTVQPDRRLHSTSGWRLSGDANGCVLDHLMPVARQSSAAACWQAVACPVHPCVRGGGGGRMGAGGAA